MISVNPLQIFTNKLPLSVDICGFLVKKGEQSIVPPSIAACPANVLASRFSSACSCLGVEATTLVALLHTPRLSKIEMLVLYSSPNCQNVSLGLARRLWSVYWPRWKQRRPARECGAVPQDERGMHIWIPWWGIKLHIFLSCTATFAPSSAVCA